MPKKVNFRLFILMPPLLFGTFNDDSLTTPIFAMHLCSPNFLSQFCHHRNQKVESVEYFAHWEIGNSEWHIQARQRYYVIW